MPREISNKAVVIVHYKTTHNNLKDQAHQYFDMIWKVGHLERSEAYKHMAEWFSVAEPEVHMRNATPQMCKDIIYRSIQLLNDIRRLDLDWNDPIKTPYFELV